MSIEAQSLKPGRLLCVTKGEYSDHCLMGFFVILAAFDHAAELAEYLDTNPKQKEDYEFEEDQFIAALIGKGLLLEVEHDTLHLGDYGCHDRVSFYPAGGEEP